MTSAEPIVEFIPPKLTLDSVDVNVKDDSVIEIETRFTVWTDEPGDQPIVYYNIGDTYFSRDAMLISDEPKQHVFVDILTLKVFDLLNSRVFIDVDEFSRIIDLADYLNIENDEQEFPRTSVWVML